MPVIGVRTRCLIGQGRLLTELVFLRDDVPDACREFFPCGIRPGFAGCLLSRCDQARIVGNLTGDDAFVQTWLTGRRIEVPQHGQ